jgi:hypothetical protein
MLATVWFVTEAGKLTAEEEKNKLERCAHSSDQNAPSADQNLCGKSAFGLYKKKQVVETTCGSHEKTSRDSSTKPGKLPLKNRIPRGNIFHCKINIFLFR